MFNGNNIKKAGTNVVRFLGTESTKK